MIGLQPLALTFEDRRWFNAAQRKGRRPEDPPPRLVHKDRPLLEVGAHAEEDVTAQRIIELRVGVAVATSAGGCRQRRIGVEHVVHADPGADIFQDISPTRPDRGSKPTRY